jgi:hypothetical protein
VVGERRRVRRGRHDASLHRRERQPSAPSSIEG